MRTLEKKHPLAIRWFHWVNFPLLALMIWSGILIYWAYPAYIRLDQKIWRALHINNRLAEGMALHFFFMWLFAINGALYVLYTLVSGEWRQLVPNRHSFREAWHVFLHDLRIRKEPPPPRKFNGAQQIAYTMVIVMGVGSLLSGLAIYKPVQFAWLVWLFGGYQFARFVHFALTAGYVLFFFVHIAQVIRAGWNNFRAMVIGVEVREVADVEPVLEELPGDPVAQLPGVTDRETVALEELPGRPVAQLPGETDRETVALEELPGDPVAQLPGETDWETGQPGDRETVAEAQ